MTTQRNREAALRHQDAARGAHRGAPWRPAPALLASAALHVAAVPTLIAAPGAWGPVLAALAANHLALGLLGLAPGGGWIGPSLTRLPPAATGMVALTFDDGPDPEATPRVLEILDRYGARASFFCIGHRAALYPDLVRRIAACGHSVENHSHWHGGAFAARPPWRIRRELVQAQAVLTAITGRAPHFIRAPFGIRGPMLDPALAGTGLRHAGWTRRGRDTVCGVPATVLARLTSALRSGDILMLHDGGSARTATGEPVVLAVLPALLDTIRAAGLRATSLPEAMDAAMDAPGAQAVRSPAAPSAAWAAASRATGTR